MKNDAPKPLSIYILCHNRPVDTRQAIKSVINQTNQNFTLIISDNSSNDEVENLVKKEFPQSQYVRRVPMLPALEHFNQCISEVSSDYFCLFHDDDIMHEDFVATCMSYIQEMPGAVAFGCNARIEHQGKLSQQTSFKSYKDVERLTSARDLAKKYFSRYQSGFAPFPGYVYNKKLMGDILIPKDGGKYADVTWLLKMAQRGEFVWIAKPLMTYRFHGGNDGSFESPRDRLRFMGYLKKNLTVLGSDILDDYRCSFVYKKILKSNDRVHFDRKKLAKKFLFGYNIRRYFRLATYHALLGRLLTKWMAAT